MRLNLYMYKCLGVIMYALTRWQIILYLSPLSILLSYLIQYKLFLLWIIVTILYASINYVMIFRVKYMFYLDFRLKWHHSCSNALIFSCVVVNIMRLEYLGFSTILNEIQPSLVFIMQVLDLSKIFSVLYYGVFSYGKF